MSYYCQEHGWSNPNFSCPACQRLFTSSNSITLVSKSELKRQAVLNPLDVAETIHQLQSTLARYEKALEYYAAPLTYFTEWRHLPNSQEVVPEKSIWRDQGAIAREALGRKE